VEDVFSYFEKPKDPIRFNLIKMGIASPEKILSWSKGEVKKPETINYRTFKPERDGLFCERIFGPSRDWECHCGKYKKVKFKGIICDRCGVEVTRAKVRRRRMGHIELAAPVCHIWYLKGVPSPIGLLLDMSPRPLEKVIYFASYIVTHVDHSRITEGLQEAQRVAQEYREEELEGFERWRVNQLEQLEELKERALSEEALAEGRAAAILAAGPGSEPASAEAASSEAEGDEGDEDLVDDLDEGIDEGDDSFGDRPLDPAQLERDFQDRISMEEEALRERLTEIDAALELLGRVEKKQLISELEYRALMRLLEILSERLGEDYAGAVRAGLGAQAIRDLLSEIDLEELGRELRKEIEETTSGPKRARAIKRLSMVEGFRKSRNRPEWMILDCVPVLPPELRPMVQLDGGRFATSDVNDLYRRIINRNNRLRRIIDIKAPESIINHEKRLLQESVDALIDNSRRAHPVAGTNRRPLKSLSDLLKGKDGRFRKNLLGKRVDYSGRSVIVIGPELKLHQCGLPREMALELFKPFVMKRLVENGFTTNIKTAKRMVDRLKPEVWDALEDVIEDHPVMLNRAPTLHRLGIQAFEPVLVDGKAIKIHPLVCEAFNADFDGDQMAVHVPLSAHAQAEARILMLADRNLFKPADGRPVVAPLYDIVLGCYYLTQLSREDTSGDPTRYFASPEEALLAYEAGQWDVHRSAFVRVERLQIEADIEREPNVALMDRLEALCGQAHGRRFERRGPHLSYDDAPIAFTAQEAADAVAAREEAERAKAEAQADVDNRDEAVEDMAGLEATLASIAGRAPVVASGPEALREQLEEAVAEALQEGTVAPESTFRFAIVRDRVHTTVGRLIVNSLAPIDMHLHDQLFDRKALSRLVAGLHHKHGAIRAVQYLDDIKKLGFDYSTRAGISISCSDMDIETGRDKLISETETKIVDLNRQFRRGYITQSEREQLVLESWLRASDNVVRSIREHIDPFNPISMMVDSGARGSHRQVSQLAGMRGLMTDPFGRLIEDLPVKSNFREGLHCLEYFVSTHGARKGLADTALRTADAGYLTRRLVDVAQDVIVRDVDCGTAQGIEVSPIYEEDCFCRRCGEEDLHRDGEPPWNCQYCGAELPTVSANLAVPLDQRLTGRVAAEPIIDEETGEVIVNAGEFFTNETSARVVATGMRRVRIRSPLTCELRQGICVLCYGVDMASWRPVEIGEAIGIIAAQSIGEPGTQLTMRTFHTGGVAAKYLTGVADVKRKRQDTIRQLHEDISRGLVQLDAGEQERENVKAIQAVLKVLEDPVGGLLRVVELFEARKPKGMAIVTHLDGAVAKIDETGLRRVIIHSELPVDETNILRGEVAAEPVRTKTDELVVDEGEELGEKQIKLLRRHKVKSVIIRRAYLVPYRGYLSVEEGMKIRAGDRLTEGPLDPQQILAMRGVRAVQEYMVREIQRVYRGQDVDINDKHIETIVRQMLRKIRVIDHGDTDLLPGQVVDRFIFEEENRRVQSLGGRPGQGEWMLLGITEASLQTESFLSAASFQKTTKVLTEAATRGMIDPLRGLKENVIIGRLIPAGSGLATYRDTDLAPLPVSAVWHEFAGVDTADDRSFRLFGADEDEHELEDTETAEAAGEADEEPGEAASEEDGEAREGGDEELFPEETIEEQEEDDEEESEIAGLTVEDPDEDSSEASPETLDD